MSTVGWIIVAVLVVPVVGLLAWVIIAESLVRVPSGSLGLLMVKGRATNTTLLPGPHFVPALRRRMVEEYPSVEFAYRAGTGENPDTRLEQSGPPMLLTLGDRAAVTLSMTVRFQLIPEQLRLVHERFGPDGLFGIVRDESSRAVTAALGDVGIGVSSLLGADRAVCQERVSAAVAKALRDDGINVTAVVLGAIDLGRTGEVIQATVRAGYELEREKAEAATRMSRALNDADLETHLSSTNDAAWRYRETDLWRDLVQRANALQVALRQGPAGTTIGIAAQDEATTAYEGNQSPVGDAPAAGREA
ncbi:SPFH domain-containing protein [Jatrophihabitans sp. DSM 45814]